ncbi:hypothetical protein FB451DRAFT_1571144 [Mycena latifolia]|nr:hypothetical protein FB451DRAFT_1571144 [Mycena latifolia]
MHSNLQRLPAERARHPGRKRLPSQGWSNAPPVARQFTLTGPITITRITPIQTTANADTTTSTTSVTSTSVLTAPGPVTEPTDTLPSDSLTNTLPSNTALPSDTALPPASSAPAVTSPPVVDPSSVLPPSPVASAIIPSHSAEGVTSNNGNGVAGVSAQHGLPTGAIVGITIACVMLILGAFVFFIRQRAIRNRKLRRQTAPWMGTQQSGNSSFGPREVAQYPAAGAGNMGETSPGVSFARSQAAALAALVPVPNMPAPMPSSYNNPTPAAPAGALPSALVRYEFIPTLPDELSITTGELVRIVAEYDDGWALCKNGRGEQGMVPLECLDRGSSPAQQALLAVEQQDYRNSRRTSSLGARY